MENRNENLNKSFTGNDMNHGSLFSGIGGFDLAAQWMGWNNKFHCEWDEFGQRILNYYWPEATSYGDITKTDFTIWNGSIDILTGGFPCQPYSQAGKRRGKDDERHLWPEMLRAVKEIKPRWIVGENVYGIVNWNGGLVFEEVQADLENEGYKVQPYILPAAAVNAPHRRDRVWFVAHSESVSCGNGTRNDRYEPQTISQKRPNESFNAANPSEIRSQGWIKATNTGNIEGESGRLDRKHSISKWRQFPTQSPVCSGNDGLSTGLDGITFPKWRRESIKGGGNAIVPQIVYQIFKTIEKYECSQF